MEQYSMGGERYINKMEKDMTQVYGSEYVKCLKKYHLYAYLRLPSR
jgi:hypothetical protein